jgi:hypothetical protein
MFIPNGQEAFCKTTWYLTVYNLPSYQRCPVGAIRGVAIRMLGSLYAYDVAVCDAAGSNGFCSLVIFIAASHM